jgi:hypothetical protein
MKKDGGHLDVTCGLNLIIKNGEIHPFNLLIFNFITGVIAKITSYRG